MKRISKIASDSIFLYALKILAKVKGIVIIPLFVSWIGLDKYGMFVQILVQVKMLAPFGHLGTGMAFYRYTSKKENKEDISRDFWSVFTFGLLLSLIVALVNFLISPLISRLFLKNAELSTLRLSSLIITVSSMHVIITKFIQSRKKFKHYAIFQAFFSILPYVSLAVGVGLTRNLFWGMFGYLLTQVSMIFTLLCFVAGQLKFTGPEIKKIKKFLNYSWPLTFSNLAGGVLSKADRYFISYFLGPAGTGVYNIIYSASSFLDTFTVPIRKYLGVYMPKLWDQDKKQLVKTRIGETMSYFLTLSVGSLTGIIFLFRPLAKLLFEKNFNRFGNLEILIGVVGLGIIAMSISRFQFQVLHFKEATKRRFFYQSLAAAMNIVLNFALVPFFGLYGAALATLGSYWLVIILAHRFVKLQYDRKFWFNLLKAGALSIALAILLYLLPKQSPIAFSATLSVGVLFYLGLVYFVKIITKQDLRKLLSRNN